MLPPQRSSQSASAGTEALADLRELIELSRLLNFDLLSEVKLVEDMCLLDCEVDLEATKRAGHFVPVYKLAERLHICLTALRAQKLVIDEVNVPKRKG